MGIPTDWTNNFRIRSNQYNAGDVIIIMVDSIYLYEQAGFKVHSILDVYEKIPELWNHIWDSRLHCNKVVNKYLAERFCELLPDRMELETNTFKQPPCMFGEAENQHIANNIEHPELDSWRNSLDKFHTEKEAVIGSIVMNCNPFTFGHRYLIEYASRHVDYLYIFLVEENRSFFDFNDRMEIVKKSVEDLENVKVIPSGSYIISTMTLPDYFRKEELQDIKLDATLDLELFSTKIAPYLNITVRFAGEEPLDKFTRQYNKAMKIILPKYGIKFVEIERKNMDEEPISASKVRKKLKEGDYESIKRLVPEVTYDYLVKRFR
jgi:[citrate (pro-3S)-lyase] ligase